MNENFATDELLYLPASEGSLPHITPAMIIDALSGIEIISKPSKPRRCFRWFISLSDGNSTFSTPADMHAASLLFICPFEGAATFLAKNPSAFALIHAGNADEVSLSMLEDHLDRCIVVAGVDKMNLTLLIQSYFIKILLWENDLKNISLRGGSLAEIIDASTPVIKNFIFISDNNFNVVCRTSHVDPPDELHQGIVDRGCLTPTTIAEKRFRLPEKTYYTRKASHITPFDRVSYPIHINHSYYGSVSMACNEYPDTEGLRDIFTTLVKTIHPVCARLWSSNATFNLPSYFFFLKLLEHEEISAAYLQAQLEMAGLSDAQRFKLVILDIDEGVEPERTIAVSRAASSLNDGRVICFPYKNQLIGFLYAGEGDAELAHAVTIKELDTRICQPFGIECGMSSLFESITDLDLGYKQARIALGFKRAIQSELFAGEEAGQRTNVYLFEEAMPYYLVDPHGKDSRFVRAMFSPSIPRMLHEEDLANGTNHVALLWFWLKDERNATSVSKRLHMHRNTVLYHIDKIEKRFNFDLGKKTARDWLLLSFKHFFLTQSDSSLTKIFEEEQIES